MNKDYSKMRNKKIMSPVLTDSCEWMWLKTLSFEFNFHFYDEESSDGGSTDLNFTER